MVVAIVMKFWSSQPAVLMVWAIILGVSSSCLSTPGIAGKLLQDILVEAPFQVGQIFGSVIDNRRSAYVDMFENQGLERIGGNQDTEMIFRGVEVSSGRDHLGQDLDDDNFMLRIKDLPALPFVDVNDVYGIPWRHSVVDVIPDLPVIPW